MIRSPATAQLLAKRSGAACSEATCPFGNRKCQNDNRKSNWCQKETNYPTSSIVCGNKGGPVLCGNGGANSPSCTLTKRHAKKRGRLTIILGLDQRSWAGQNRVADPNPQLLIIGQPLLFAPFATPKSCGLPLNSPINESKKNATKAAPSQC